jgi:hypothetical protein
MANFIRTVRGRLEAFNSRSELNDELRVLLKFIDGRRAISELQKALKPHICTPANIQKLIDADLIVPADAWTDSSTDAKPGSKSYLPTKPAELSHFAAISQDATTESADQTAYLTQNTLAEAKECMGDFVLRHTPQSAFLLLSEIENFKTIEQLQASLVSYEQLIRHAEIHAARHMRDLRQIIAKSYSSELRQGS